MSSGEWLARLNWMEIIGMTAATIAIVASVYGVILQHKAQQSNRSHLTPEDQRLLLDLVDHEGSLGGNQHENDYTFAVSDSLGTVFYVVQGPEQTGRPVSRAAFSNLERLGLVVKVRGGFLITPEGHTQAAHLRHHPWWALWRDQDTLG